jgi:cobalamin biosynthesis protein CobD/CbiB
VSIAYRFALALAVALIDVTVGYPSGLARRIGTPARWLATWLAIVRGAGGSGGGGLALYLAPVAVGATLVSGLLPSGPLGFAASALLASAFCGRQSLDRRASLVARLSEHEGPYEALAAAEPLGPDEAEPRVSRAAAAAIAARFADEAAAPTVFILIGGLTGAALCCALVVAGRACRERRDSSDFAATLADVERWTLAPAARLGALFLALAAPLSARAFRAVAAPAPRPTAPAETAALAALGESAPDDPAYLRRALALFRRAAAAELIVLAGLSLLTAFVL